MKNTWKVLLGLVGFLATSYLLLATVSAQTQQPFNITSSPNSFDIKVDPGSTTTEKMRLRNNSDTPLSLTVSVKKLTPDVNGDVTIADFPMHAAEKDWITVPSTVSALPREWTTIPFTISIPKEAAFGYYYALFISPADANGNAVTAPQAKLHASLAIPLLVYVQKPGAKTDAQFVSFESNASFFEFLPVTFTTIFANKGNVHSKPVGNIFIKDWTGATVATLDINKTAGSVLPSAKRAFTTVWDDSFITNEPVVEDGKQVVNSHGQPQTKWVFHFDRVLSLRFGKYTAHALVVVSGESHDVSYEMATTFWVFPWRIFLALLLVVILAGVGLLNTIVTLWHHGKRMLGK